MTLLAGKVGTLELVTLPCFPLEWLAIWLIPLCAPGKQSWMVGSAQVWQREGDQLEMARTRASFFLLFLICQQLSWKQMKEITGIPPKHYVEI